MSAIGLLGVVCYGIGAVAQIWVAPKPEYLVIAFIGVAVAAFDALRHSK